MDNDFLINIVLAILPGTIWLIYFLKQDVRPEPKAQILKIFILGFLVSIPTAFFELLLIKGLVQLYLFEYLYIMVKSILVIGFIEELFKYLVVRLAILDSPDIDEPIDIPLYMTISALGFATAENILVFFTQSQPLLSDHLLLSFSRFIGATLLHALCSGLLGYFMSLSACLRKFKRTLFILGFSIAVILHGLFDFFLSSSIIKAVGNGDGSSAGYSIIIVIILFVCLSLGFRQIKKLKLICKV